MTAKNENISLTVAISVTIGTAIVFLFLFIFLGINYRRDVYNDSKKLAAEISRKAAFETQVYLSTAILTAKSLEQKVQLIKRLKGSRVEISNVLISAINENQNYLGVWTLWEPNAFDQKDYLYKGNSKYNIEGTIGMGYFRYQDSIFYEVMTLADYEGTHYVAPKESKKEKIIEPYKFVYTGYKQVFFGTTISIPIIDNDNFIGAIGIDIDLGSLQKKLNKIRPYEAGYLSLISESGKIITHIDSSLINQNIFEFLSKNDSLSFMAISNGKELMFECVSEFTGDKVLRLFYPINVGEACKSWSMMVEIPLNNATVRSKQLLYVAIIVLVIGLSLLVYLLVNISDRKEFERKLLDSKNLAEESDRLKTAFLNNVSHEIRTPLNGILGFSELLTESDHNGKDIVVYKDIIRKSGKQLLSIVSNVMELSKIQSGKVKMQIREFNLEKALIKTIYTFKTLSLKEDIELITKFPETSARDIISTDEDKFTQVLTYLLNNAFKFTKEGFVELGYSVRKNHYLFYVKDTGIGIMKENVDKIFKSFMQVDGRSTRNFGGLGVGLTISKAFLDALGGSIWLESEIGKGSVFYVSLPIK